MTETVELRRVAITGAGGFIGQALTASLERDGIEVLRLVRHEPGRGEVRWDPDLGEIDATRLEGLDGVVHLAGENIASVWTPAKKRRIMESRAQGTRLLAQAIASLSRPPATLVSASGVGYYGDAGDAMLTESSPPGDDFLARVCVAWEEATRPAAAAGIRVVNTRFGLVIDPAGGALRLMLLPFRLGLGARLGSGTQWMSWIARVDVVRVLRFALATSELSGPVNAVSPHPVTNEEFTRILARSLRRPAAFAVPSFLLKTFTGGMAESLLASQRAVPAVLGSLGFSFERPSLADAIAGGGVD
jgi:uncharacterized protein (TIGR01777 family)